MGNKTLLADRLKRWPILFRLVEKVYFALKPVRIKEVFLGTGAREKEWASRHLSKGSNWTGKQYAGDDDEWVMGYWDSRDHPHRPFLIKKIAPFAPFSSILEIGANCGPNLYLLAQRFPDVEMVGVDINPRAVEKGNELLAAEGVSNVRLLVAKADELGQFQDKSFDVVFTDAVLIYIGPDKIKNVVQDMLRVARRALILMERQSFESSGKDPHGLGVSHNDLWLRDYTVLFKQFVPEEQMAITKITGDIWPDSTHLGWQETGVFVEVNL